MEPVAHLELPDGSQIPVFDPADLNTSPAFRFKHNGQEVAFLLADPAEATHPQLRFKVGGNVMCPTAEDPNTGPTFEVLDFFWTTPLPDPYAGEPYEVHAIIYNASIGTQEGYINYNREGTTLETKYRSLDPFEIDEVVFEATAPDVAGEYPHALETSAEHIQQTLEVDGDPFWEIIDFWPIEISISKNNYISVNVTIENTGTKWGDAEVKYKVGDRTASDVVATDVSVGQTVDFSFETKAAEDPDSYLQMAETVHDALEGNVTIEPSAITVDNYSHDALTDYYQGDVDSYTTTDEWHADGDRSLTAKNSDDANVIRSFPSGNPNREHSLSLDRYPQQGDTIRIVGQVTEFHNEKYNEPGHVPTFVFNTDSPGEEIAYSHHMHLTNPYHEIRDEYRSRSDQEEVPATLEPGDVLTYELRWNSSDTVTVSIKRRGQTLPGGFTTQISPPASDPGFGFSIRGTGGTPMRISHIEVED